MATIFEFMQEHGLNFFPELDGKIHRFDGQSKKSKSGWYVGHQAGANQFLIIGDWSTGDVEKWSNKKSLIKSVEFSEVMAKSIRDAIDMRTEIHAKAAAECREIFTKPGISVGLESFEYCKRKGITNLYGAKFFEDRFGAFLAIPLIDNDGKIWTIQKIYQDGSKMFHPGGKKLGNYFVINGTTDVVYLCEGFATAASIHEATMATVVVSFDAGNLMAVAQNVAPKFASSKIVCAADNDQFSKENIGVKRAGELKAKMKIDYIIPQFTDGQKDQRPTDFNDLHMMAGIDAVKRQVVYVKADDSPFADSPEYLIYKEFFESIFPNTKKCKFSNLIISTIDGKEVYVENQLSTIRGSAIIRGLDRTKAMDYFHVWLYRLKPELRVSFIDHDGVDHIANVLKFVKIEKFNHDYFVELFKEWMAGIFKRLENPLVQNKMMILGGDQGLGKDTFIENMFCDLRPYFTSYGILEKDAENFDVMSRSILINISEFDRTSKLQVSQLKNVITAHEATFRRPYSRSSERVEFSTSFISSVNIEDVFRDETGNRRFLYFKLKAIDWNYPKGISDKILAQARSLAAENYVASDAAQDALNLIISDMTPDNWEIGAHEIWNARILELEKITGRTHFQYPEINRIMHEIAMSLNVTNGMVRSFIKRNYQLKKSTGRVYLRKPDLIS